MERGRQNRTESTRESNGALLHDEIARLAYALWEARGGGDGFAEQDWLEAEQRLQKTQLREPSELQTEFQTA